MQCHSRSLHDHESKPAAANSDEQTSGMQCHGYILHDHESEAYSFTMTLAVLPTTVERRPISCHCRTCAMLLTILPLPLMPVACSTGAISLSIKRSISLTVITTAQSLLQPVSHTLCCSFPSHTVLPFQVDCSSDSWFAVIPHFTLPASKFHTSNMMTETTPSSGVQ